MVIADDERVHRVLDWLKLKFVQSEPTQRSETPRLMQRSA